MKKAAILFIILALPLLLAAGDKKTGQDKKAWEPKVIKAVRAEEPIVIDAALNEKVWQTTPNNGFTQHDPKDGDPSSERTDVWVAYDDKALYVAAYCHDSDPKGIKALMGRRDSQIDSDWFYFAVDPYYDKRSGFLFGVNPAGSILDEVLSNDVNEDTSWDGVWESKAAINGEGWIVEMKIPFNQIRFAKKDEYVWGVNFSRVIKRKQERASFSWVPK
ncbi:MAG: carbohydrate binding family 9 domain-containing protein, partial [Candidatus Aminicenantes bacterium]|nr:carbohydrate binding family 9 domain-containing protein [Candidatus Aminicenantes bacterium]